MRDMKILMIKTILDKEMVFEEIGLCSITAFLRKHNFNVKLMGVAKDKINYQDISDYQPDVIGVSVFTSSFAMVREICEKLKPALPGCMICLGGETATFDAVQLLEQVPEVDFIVKGEGEITFLELVTCLTEERSDYNQIKGLVYRNAGKIIENEARELIENLDDLPFMSRDLLIENNLRVAMLSTSRGCSKSCFFCCSHNFWKNNNKYQWRGRSPQHIVDEIEYLYREFDIKQFWFADPSFEDPGFNAERMEAIAQEIIRRQLKITYYVYIRASFYRHATLELIDILVKSGLCSVLVGIESANTHDLKEIYGKSASVEDNRAVLEFFKKCNISVEIGFINLNPYSSFEGLHENARFLRESGHAGFFFLYANSLRIYKGSAIYAKMERDGMLRRKSIDDDYGYVFVNPKIAKLSNFLADFLEDLTNHSIVHKIFVVTRQHPARMARFKRHFEVENKPVLDRLIKEHEQNLGFIFNDLEGRAIEWFDKILNLAEANWEESKARELCETYLGYPYLTDTLTNFNNEIFRFYKNLANQDKQYIRYL
jgi:anaerobic magnesium-protoporphyrin IX monomethyl ester cyclase